VIAVLSTLGWAVTHWRQRSHRARAATAGHENNEQPSLKAARDAVIAACRNNDPIAARRDLARWATQYWPSEHLTTLGMIALRSSPELAREADRLNAALYAAQRTPWSGQALADAIRAEPRQKVAPRGGASVVLAPLVRIVPQGN